jgi:hypothetical protein
LRTRTEMVKEMSAAPGRSVFYDFVKYRAEHQADPNAGQQDKAAQRDKSADLDNSANQEQRPARDAPDYDTGL